MLLTVKPPTTGLVHQLADVTQRGDRHAWARLWEMGVGKTWPTLVEAAQLYADKLIDVLVIVAPKSVAVNWILDQIPKHMPPEVNAACHAFDIVTRKTDHHVRAVHRLLEHKRQRRGLVVLACSYEGVLEESCKDLLKTLMLDDQARPTGRSMLVADESSYIANNDSKRTQRMYSLASIAGYRRILEGTPVTNDPRNIYSQMVFLDERYWSKYGIRSYVAFTSTFCKIVKPKNLTVIHKASGKSVRVPKVVGYQNLDYLQKLLLAGASRLTTEEAGIHLPAQTYQRLRFDLHPKQRKVYDQLRRDMLADLGDGKLVAVTMAVTLLLRLQQVTSGYLPVMDEQGEIQVHRILDEKEDPRLQLLLEHLGLVPHQTIIFARFTAEIDTICRAIPAVLKETCVRFDGTTSTSKRQEALAAFTGGDAKFMVAHVQAAGRGLTLTNGKRTVYYSNTFSFGDRAQSEKRIHRIGQRDPCFYDDLEARNTVDGRIIRALRNKHEIAAQITGDVLREWLTE